MRKVIVSTPVLEKMAGLKTFLTQVYKMSQTAANARMDRIETFLRTLSGPGIAARCRYRPWFESGWRCVSFEGWVFACEIVPEGVIIREMAHGSLLVDVIY